MNSFITEYMLITIKINVLKGSFSSLISFAWETDKISAERSTADATGCSDTRKER